MPSLKEDLANSLKDALHHLDYSFKKVQRLALKLS